ncbi:odorant receptor 33b-like [Scaptodrosophila lebanonensis]|uniref:Odorant receptor 33b-like n=1 Tax=Drosophila lebanonensis TaxID=7225 RepID=A0A6J2U1Q0_DROLE|nr:odorant receptor 33b-like [Scaptodrosophila lebanonensis]
MRESSPHVRFLVYGYDLCLNVGITICYPLHLIIGVFLTSSKDDIFKNLIINVTCLICTLQHWCLRYKLRNQYAIEALLSTLDQRVIDASAGQAAAQRVAGQARIIVRLFLFAATAANLSAILGVLLNSERRLMYPGWIPFDWQSSNSLYWLALCYQFIGVTIQITQNLINDIYPALVLCLLAGHVRLLGLRIAKIGNEEIKDEISSHFVCAEKANAELILYIEDHKKIIKLSSSVLLTAGHDFVRLDVELTLREFTMYAARLVGIHLDSFFATVKMAYSLFAVVLRIK